MSYELSFTEDFFTGSEEYYDPSDRPTNCLQAIESLSDEEQLEICKNVFGIGDPLFIESEMFSSYVLEAIRVPKSVAHTSIRIGLGRFTTKAEVEFAAQSVVEAYAKLKKGS